MLIIMLIYIVMFCQLLRKADEIDNYLEKVNILDDFVKYAAEKGIPRDRKGLKESGYNYKNTGKSVHCPKYYWRRGFLSNYQTN